MSHDLICSWLGLAPGEWPPNHYRLLGLQPGEADVAVIEQHVHERLDAVRRYQMMHPEPATEAMNRLAQAFVCLTDPASKRVYDRQLLGDRAPEPAPQTTTAVLPEPPQAKVGSGSGTFRPAPSKTPSTPPPSVRPAPVTVSTPTPPPLAPLPPLPAPQAQVETRVASGETTVVPAEPGPSPVPAAPATSTAAPDAPAVPAPPPDPLDPIVEAAESPLARRGLGSKRSLYYRIARTRELLQAWGDMEPFLASPHKRIRKKPEGVELRRRLERVGELLRGFPPLLGEAGQPGYLVLALRQLGKAPPFDTFSLHQREALSRDWRAGLKLLQAHRRFLRSQVHGLRKRGLRRRLPREVRHLVTERPGVLLVLLSLLAVNIALWRTYASEWLAHLLNR